MTIQSTKSIGELLPVEIARCQALLADYKSVGRPGLLAATCLESSIRMANKAMMEQDVVTMIAVYQELKEAC